jgi:hypothetical protein
MSKHAYTEQTGWKVVDICKLETPISTVYLHVICSSQDLRQLYTDSYFDLLVQWRAQQSVSRASHLGTETDPVFET